MMTPLPCQPSQQFAMTIVVPVLPPKLDQLRAVLQKLRSQAMARMHGHQVEAALARFDEVAGLHYARIVIIESYERFDSPPMLVLSTNFDGPIDRRCSEARAKVEHVDELLLRLRVAIDRIFQCCVDYPGELASHAEIRDYLLNGRRQVTARCFFVGAPGRSRTQIEAEAELRERVEQFVDTRAVQWRSEGATPEAILDEVRRELGPVPEYPAQPERKWRVSLTMFLMLVSVLVLGGVLGDILGFAPWQGALTLVGLACLAVVAIFVTLEYKEANDQPFEIRRTYGEINRIQWAREDEDQWYQNQLTHLVDVKVGPFRALVLRGALWISSLMAANVYNRGRLGEISSIHFARWLLVDGGRRLLFMSDFDNSWENYLSEFIDRASAGLTAVWSNTQGYPRTRGLVHASPRDAERFKAWARHHQVPTQVWYCAYPGLSIQNINDNTAIRRGLSASRPMSAVAWLYRLRATGWPQPPVAPAKPSRPLSVPLPLAGIQGIIMRGYGHKPFGEYMMLRITDVSLARPWVAQIPLTPAVSASRHHSRADQDPFVNVALTHSGMVALELDDALIEQFPIEFIEGSHHSTRSRTLGDLGPSAPQHWRWGSAENPVHLCLMVYASTRASRTQWVERFADQARAHGLELVASISGDQLPGRKEHFGFRAGIAQPVIAGSGRDEAMFNTIPAGEILLGYEDAYGNNTHPPTVHRERESQFDFGRDGSFMVVRQLAQDVEGFWRYARASGELGVVDGDGVDATVAAASKMVGRWPSGASLVLHPEADPEDTALQNEDRFAYRDPARDDSSGARCPFGAHIRRANPRDWALAADRAISMRRANRHRIIRRGRPYGPAIVADMQAPQLAEIGPEQPPSEAERGLAFICFNASIRRQFEFIQQQWVNNPHFSGLSSDPDPIVGAQPGPESGITTSRFSVQSDMQRLGPSPRCPEMPRFVEVRGSAYFFMPSLSAVRALDDPALLRKRR